MPYIFDSGNWLSDEHLHKNRGVPAAHFPVIYGNRIFMVHEFGNIRRSVVLSVRIASMFVRCVTTSDVITEHLDHVSSDEIVLNPVETTFPFPSKKRNHLFSVLSYISSLLDELQITRFRYSSRIANFFFVLGIRCRYERNEGEEVIRKCETHLEHLSRVLLDNQITRKYFSKRFTWHSDARLTFDRPVVEFDYAFDNSFGAWWKR